MFHFSRRLVLVGAVLVVMALVAVVAMQPQLAAGSIPPPVDTIGDSLPQQGIITTTAQYLWSFSAKFVCGFLPTPTQPGAVGEPPVKPGNYATDINIHNYNYRDLKIHKKLLVLVGTPQPGAVVQPPFVLREPQVARPYKFMPIVLGPDYATMDDCNAIWQMAAQTGPPLQPGALTIGYLVILSQLDLDVDVVYTAEVPANVPGQPQPVPSGISIDVNRVTGKRFYTPANTLP
jgi:hypothetical protein